jgi:thiol-disulfide isomerase/thioredoxin
LEISSALVERASDGEPLVYGWVVDFLYVGFESIAFDEGMKLLKPHVNNPGCLTKRNREINKRLEGIEAIKEGVILPSYSLPDANDSLVGIFQKKSSKPYRLIVFWGADCPHCRELLPQIFDWYQKPEIKDWMEITTIEMGDDITLWRKILPDLPKDVLHLYSPGGINSPISNDFYILSTPEMFVTRPNGKVEFKPKDFKELKKFID